MSLIIDLFLLKNDFIEEWNRFIFNEISLNLEYEICFVIVDINVIEIFLIDSCLFEFCLMFLKD